METWAIWSSLAFAVVILELLTGTFYLLMVSTGLIVAAVISYLGGGVAIQFVAATITSTAATIALHKSKYSFKNNRDVSINPNVNIDIGQVLEVNEWKESGTGIYTANAHYRGANWQVETHAHHQPSSGTFKIVEVSSNKLIVKAN